MATTKILTEDGKLAVAELRFIEGGAGSDYVGFKAAGAVASSLAWSLPATDGSSGGFLRTDGSTVLSWGSGSSFFNCGNERTSVSNGSNGFLKLNGTDAGLFADETDVEVPMGFAGDFGALCVSVNEHDLQSSETVTLTLRKNNADTALVVTFNDSHVEETVICDTETVAFAATDRIDLELSASVAATRTIQIGWSVQTRGQSVGGAAQRTFAVRKNSGANVGSRPRLNFIEGLNVTVDVTNDSVDDEVDIQINSSLGGDELFEEHKANDEVTFAGRVVDKGTGVTEEFGQSGNLDSSGFKWFPGSNADGLAGGSKLELAYWNQVTANGSGDGEEGYGRWFNPSQGGLGVLRWNASTHSTRPRDVDLFWEDPTDNSLNRTNIGQWTLGTMHHVLITLTARGDPAMGVGRLFDVDVAIDGVGTASEAGVLGTAGGIPDRWTPLVVTATAPTVVMASPIYFRATNVV